jgi:hypothetical protein
MLQSCRECVDRDGFVVLSGVFTADEVAALTADLTQALAGPCEAALVRSPEGCVYAARNVLDLWPAATSLWRRSLLTDLLRAVLGPHCGLVRGLFFDKPAEQSWALPWHKDLTVAVREHGPTTGGFRNPTRKAGVPHMEAPLEVLQTMLTLRIHLDDVTDQNGPMNVIPGSHQTGKQMDIDEALSHPVFARQGDVLAIRPLVVHNSRASQPGNQRHRRVLHLEFAAEPELPGGYEWHRFIAV